MCSDFEERCRRWFPLVRCELRPRRRGADALLLRRPAGELLTVRADREALAEIRRRGQEIVVGEILERPSRCRGGVPTALNTDTLRVLARGEFDFVRVSLAGGPLAPGATPESEGASEIEVAYEFTASEPLVTLVGASDSDEFHWAVEDGRSGVNVNPGDPGDGDVDVSVPGTGLFGGALIAGGAAGDDRFIPALGARLPDQVWALGGAGDDFMMLPAVARASWREDRATTSSWAAARSTCSTEGRETTASQGPVAAI
jgi:hypothetical protein